MTNEQEQSKSEPARDPFEGLKPGRIVYFVVDQQAELSINGRYADANSPAGVSLIVSQSVAQVHVGNRVHAGEIIPAMVTAVFGTQGICNLKVMLDGNDTYWATSVSYNAEKAQRSWHWMFKGQNTRYRPDRVETSVPSA